MTDTHDSERIHHAGTTPILSYHGKDRAELTLNRPAFHNRLEPGDLATLREHIAMLNDDRAVRVVMLTGAGTRTFSSGYHLGAFDAARTDDDTAFEQVANAIEGMRAVTIARVNGAVYGGASDLALACDFRVGTHDTRMSVPAARLGLHFYGSGIRRWVSRVGVNATKRAFLAAQTFSSQELVACGFLTQAVEATELDAECTALIDRLCALAPLAVQGMKRIINAAAHAEYDERAAREQCLDSMRSKDFAEGLAALAAKRPPVFTGE
uniref:enoyl-CoA hydratase/isomerase family protein n=1 Tax=Burkholderia anthina TaxID=179879 RepID=UPI00158C1FFA|nr:enoyl-CoA hydratase/isomerase family protein [Burkholderia anthina]